MEKELKTKLIDQLKELAAKTDQAICELQKEDDFNSTVLSSNVCESMPDLLEDIGDSIFGQSVTFLD